MDIDIKIQQHVYFGLALLFLVMSAKAEMIENIDSIAKSFINVQPIRDIDVNKLATSVLVDTENEFEAILFDQQSQLTIGHLYWNQREAGGEIDFEYGDAKGQIGIHVSNIEAIELSERYETLLRGLHEAGIAWLSQINIDTSLNSSNTLKDERGSMIKPLLFKPVGHFGGVTPQTLSNAYGSWPETGVSRYAQGWAYDPDRPDQSVWVHFYGERENYEPIYLGALLANINRPDVNRAYGISGLHGWRAQIPESWDADGYQDVDGVCNSHPLSYVDSFCWIRFFASAIDLTGDGPQRLGNIPYVINAVKYQRPTQ